MKRYQVYKSEKYYTYEENPNGEFVKYEDVKKLTDQLIVLLKLIKAYACSLDISYLSHIYDLASEALTKVKGEL